MSMLFPMLEQRSDVIVPFFFFHTLYCRMRRCSGIIPVSCEMLPTWCLQHYPHLLLHPSPSEFGLMGVSDCSVACCHSTIWIVRWPQRAFLGQPGSLWRTTCRPRDGVLPVGWLGVLSWWVALRVLSAQVACGSPASSPLPPLLVALVP